MGTCSNREADARLLRWAIAFVWLATGLLVVVPYYRDVGTHYLSRLGLPPLVMYATCLAEIALGLRVALGRAATWLTILQVGTILTFSAILVVLEPIMLVSPVGLITKNVPLLAVIGTAWVLEREGWTPRVAWLLRCGIGFIWIAEGIVSKVLFQQETELRIVAESGLVPGDPGDFLFWMGLAEAASGLLVFALHGRPLRVLLACQLVALVVLPILVSWHHPEYWAHPFGGLTKNVPILVGTWVLLRRS
jgi:hypothetical protein